MRGVDWRNKWFWPVRGFGIWLGGMGWEDDWIWLRLRLRLGFEEGFVDGGYIEMAAFRLACVFGFFLEGKSEIGSIEKEVWF